MEKNDRKRLKPSLLQTDRDCFTALQRVRGYAPVNVRYNLTDLDSAHSELTDLQQAEAKALAAVAVTRKNAIAKEWEFHELILGVKDQVVAQFGRDSDEAQAVGLKKKSQYKSRARKTT